MYMDRTEKIVVSLIGIIIFVIIVGSIIWYKNHPCIQSHMETQYEAPISVVVGGGKYGGGIGIPIGNIKPVQVEVCDVRKY